MSDQNGVVAQSSSSTEQDAHATPAPKRRRGFAAMDSALVRELARRGGVAAHQAGTAHEFTSEEARLAGRKGGIAAHAGDRPATTNPTPPTSST